MAASSYHQHPTPFPVDHLLNPDHTMQKLPPFNYPPLLFPSEDDDQSVFFNDGLPYDPLLLGYLYNFHEQLSFSIRESNNVATGASATASSCCLDQSTDQLQQQPNSLIPNSSSVSSSENVEFPPPPPSLAVKQSPGGANRGQIIMGPKRKLRGYVDGSSSNSKDVGGGRGKKKQKKGDRDDVNNNNNNSNTNEINSTGGGSSTGKDMIKKGNSRSSLLPSSTSHDQAATAAAGYIHVRARRGQATDSHSLAERVRREKISKKMKLLQTLVPGCDNVTGKAMMLDEIINYVQSLQSQVEFLSMKLASLDPTSSIYNYGGGAAAAAIGMDHHHYEAFILGPEGLSRMGSPILPTEMLQQCISSSSPPASSSSQTHQTQNITSFSFPQQQQQQRQQEQQSGPSSSSNVAFCLPQETVAEDRGLFWEAAAGGGSRGYSSSGLLQY